MNSSTSKLTFLVRVNSTRNSTWTGDIEQIGCGQAFTFNDAMELILHLQAAIEREGLPQFPSRLRTWEESKHDEISW